MEKTSSAHFQWMQSTLGFTLWLQNKLKTLIPWREVAYSRLDNGSCKAFNSVWEKTRMKLESQCEEPLWTSRVFFSDPWSPETSNSVKYLSLSDEAAHSHRWWQSLSTRSCPGTRKPNGTEHGLIFRDKTILWFLYLMRVPSWGSLERCWELLFKRRWLCETCLDLCGKGLNLSSTESILSCWYVRKTRVEGVPAQSHMTWRSEMCYS